MITGSASVPGRSIRTADAARVISFAPAGERMLHEFRKGNLGEDDHPALGVDCARGNEHVRVVERAREIIEIAGIPRPIG